jgi:hypothetical protein
MSKRTLFLFGLVIVLLSACNVVRGSGNVETETREVRGFDQVSLSGQGEIILTQGEREALEIEAEDNIIEVIETEVRGDTLHIGTRNNTLLQPTEPVRFYLTMDQIDGLEVSGSGDITADSVDADHLTMEISGSGNMNIDSLIADSLEVDISGSGHVEAEGRVPDQEIEISGSGNYEAADLEGETVDVKVSGSGEATVWANEALNVDISGSGQVNYYGNPAVNQDISGSGELNSRGSR